MLSRLAFKYCFLPGDVRKHTFKSQKLQACLKQLTEYVDNGIRHGKDAALGVESLTGVGAFIRRA